MAENSSTYDQMIENCKYGILKAKWRHAERYIKRYPDIFWYQGSEIFHYTDLVGLIGILSNKGFWLSDARYLNDAEELHNGSLLSSNLMKRIVIKERHKPFSGILDGVIDELKKDSFQKHYICSFSTSVDTLEQWRAYAKNGSGVSIGFNLKKETTYPHFSLLPHYLTKKVIYDEKVKAWALLSIIQKFKNEFVSDLKSGEDPNWYKDEYINGLAEALSSIFINFKNKAFQTEQEVRLVDSSGKVDFYNNKCHRVANDMIVPYVCTYDIKIKDKPDNLPVSKIVIGPVAKQNATINSIQCLLNDLGYDDKIEVVKSRIPYRG